MPDRCANAAAIRRAIDTLLRRGVSLLIDDSPGRPYHYDIDGRVVAATDIVAYADAIDSNGPSLAEIDRDELSRPPDRIGHDALIGRAIRIIARHGICLVVTSRGDRCEFEIDGTPVREIDVIVRAAMLDIGLLSERHGRPSPDSKQVA